YYSTVNHLTILYNQLLIYILISYSTKRKRLLLKSLTIKLTLILTAIFFSACANLQIGFEEDSRFYTPPTKEKTVATPKITQDKEEETSIVTEAKVDEAVVTKPTKQEQVKEAITTKKKATTVVEKGTETTFTYSRDSGWE
ncbi:MAG: hypothetical protein ACJAWW_002110, partial [Sulfurimonas sp.]